MKHFYLSPHLDDAIFSCGGLIGQQSMDDQVIVLTLFAGGDNLNWRRMEDFEATKAVGAGAGHLFYPEAPDRDDLYKDAVNLFGHSRISDDELVLELARDIKQLIGSGSLVVYCPLAIGNHIDHRLVRRAAELLRYPLRFYYDFPYASREKEPSTYLGFPEGDEKIVKLSAVDIDLWTDAIACYRSEFIKYWKSKDEIKKELVEFHNQHGGIRLIEGKKWKR